MDTKKDTAMSNDTNSNISSPQDDADPKILRLNKETLQDLGTSEANADKVRGGQATIRRCM